MISTGFFKHSFWTSVPTSPSERSQNAFTHNKKQISKIEKLFSKLFPDLNAHPDLSILRGKIKRLSRFYGLSSVENSSKVINGDTDEMKFFRLHHRVLLLCEEKRDLGMDCIKRPDEFIKDGELTKKIGDCMKQLEKLAKEIGEFELLLEVDQLLGKMGEKRIGIEFFERMLNIEKSVEKKDIPNHLNYILLCYQRLLKEGYPVISEKINTQVTKMCKGYSIPTQHLKTIELQKLRLENREVNVLLKRLKIILNDCIFNKLDYFRSAVLLEFVDHLISNGSPLKEVADLVEILHKKDEMRINIFLKIIEGIKKGWKKDGDVVFFNSIIEKAILESKKCCVNRCRYTIQIMIAYEQLACHEKARSLVGEIKTLIDKGLDQKMYNFIETISALLLDVWETLQGNPFLKELEKTWDISNIFANSIRYDLTPCARDTHNDILVDDMLVEWLTRFAPERAEELFGTPSIKYVTKNLESMKNEEVAFALIRTKLSVEYLNKKWEIEAEQEEKIMEATFFGLHNNYSFIGMFVLKYLGIFSYTPHNVGRKSIKSLMNASQMQ